MVPQSFRADKLKLRHHFECKCISCTSNYPPFQIMPDLKLGLQEFRLLRTLEGAPFTYNAYLTIDKTELPAIEQAAIAFLKKFERHHPSEETLKMQCLLNQIWIYLFTKF